MISIQIDQLYLERFVSSFINFIAIYIHTNKILIELIQLKLFTSSGRDLLLLTQIEKFKQ